MMQEEALVAAAECQIVPQLFYCCGQGKLKGKVAEMVVGVES